MQRIYYVHKKDKNRQQKYRQAHASMELVRYELQVNAESKARFENLVRAVADEYESPWDERQRMAKARCQVFDEITQDVVHEFAGLQVHIDSLKAEIKALSPSFFIDTQQYRQCCLKPFRCHRMTPNY